MSKLDGRKTVIAVGAVLGLALLLFALCLFWRQLPRRGVDSPEDLVQIYIQALHDRDEAEIRRLVLGGYDPTEEINRRIGQLGGIEPEAVDVTFVRNPVAPYVIHVGLAAFRSTGIDATQVVTDRLTLQSNAGRWYLVLGEYHGPR